MSNMLWHLTRVNKQIELSLAKHTRLLEWYLRFFVLSTRLKKLKKLLLRLLQQQMMFRQRRKSMLPITSFPLILPELHNLSCSLKRLKLPWQLFQTHMD
nr:hypothetical protein Iba_chr02bCG11760 [Ipomoea batatas]GMC63001.1 hypothetical protein Iba_chr02cCG9190 [Ipomoea batatas]GMC64355.1 hypothetical protein Iba_chr02dCG4180 [Ipomoea batatas]GMC66565.1 hypothetical protein Iba_chr02eCG6930 [Ipomoea batatas]GMC67886.1 hypothetical protein Iba_chr02fCG6680 [Ipomoea batatas]